jgi:hypothetical protein
METKVCPRCNVEKEIVLFTVNKNRKNGHGYICKKCDNNRYRNIPIEIIKCACGCGKELNKYNKQGKSRKYIQFHKCGIEKHIATENQTKRCANCSVDKTLDNFYKNNSSRFGKGNICKSCQSIVNKNRYDNVKEQLNKDTIAYNGFRDKENNYHRSYNKKNRNRLNGYRNKRQKTEPLFKLKGTLRTRILRAFKKKGWKKNSKSEFLLGTDWSVVKRHIEKQFTKGMNWDNHGKWHIDHKVPCATAKTKEELENLFHYTNLQPLWALDNHIKNAKIIEQQLILTI